MPGVPYDRHVSPDEGADLLRGGIDADDRNRAAVQHVVAVQPPQMHLRHRRLCCAGSRPQTH